MRILFAKLLVVVTGLLIVMLAILFAVVRNTSDDSVSKATADAIASRKAQRVVSLYFRVDKDVDALYRSARRKGAKVLSPPTDMPYGMREFHLRDPDGYDVAVAQELG